MSLNTIINRWKREQRLKEDINSRESRLIGRFVADLKSLKNEKKVERQLSIFEKGKIK